jgi:hypothetical protein
MTNYSRPEPTGYAIGKCSGCAARIMAPTAAALRCEGGIAGKVFIRCTTAGCLGQRYGVACRRIMGRVTETVCGPKCTSAVGPACDCQCGGEHHGANHR